MSKRVARAIVFGAAMAFVFGFATPAGAQAALGTWVRRPDSTAPQGMTMTVEMCCGSGRRITYHVPPKDMILTVESKLDGRDAPVLLGGKPSGETMAITRLDDRHYSAVLKMNGKVFGTSKGAISVDGKTLTVENDFTAGMGGNPVGKHTETWVKK
jgi:hypothetical protein